MSRDRPTDRPAGREGALCKGGEGERGSLSLPVCPPASSVGTGPPPPPDALSPCLASLHSKNGGRKERRGVRWEGAREERGAADRPTTESLRQRGCCHFNSPRRLLNMQGNEKSLAMRLSTTERTHLLLYSPTTIHQARLQLSGCRMLIRCSLLCCVSID